jgi:hypothetical protein
MSERENVQQIEQVFAAFGRADILFIESQLTDDVHWVSHLDPIVPWSGDDSGKASVPRFSVRSAAPLMSMHTPCASSSRG